MNRLRRSWRNCVGAQDLRESMGRKRRRSGLRRHSLPAKAPPPPQAEGRVGSTSRNGLAALASNNISRQEASPAIASYRQTVLEGQFSITS
jgi:hypothetical protein